MAIRLPLQGALDITNTDTGSGSVAGGYAYPFKLPLDTDNVVVKFQPSITAAGISATFQTSDDGGSTWYDVARTSVASSSAPGVGPQWLVVPTCGGDVRNVISTSLIATGSLISTFNNGSAGASTLGSGQNSGLPIMGLQNRIFMIITGNATAHAGSRVQVLVNQTSSQA
jgi:hypothetical protein